MLRFFVAITTPEHTARLEQRLDHAEQRRGVPVARQSSALGGLDLLGQRPRTVAEATELFAREAHHASVVDAQGSRVTAMTWSSVGVALSARPLVEKYWARRSSR